MARGLDLDLTTLALAAGGAWLLLTPNGQAMLRQAVAAINVTGGAGATPTSSPAPVAATPPNVANGMQACLDIIARATPASVRRHLRCTTDASGVYRVVDGNGRPFVDGTGPGSTCDQIDLPECAGV